MTALSESSSLTIICDVFSLPISTYLLFSQVGKPILDSGPANSHKIYPPSKHASWHICGPTMSGPANRDTIYVCSKHASQHICGPTMSDPANHNIIYAQWSMVTSIRIAMYGFQLNWTLFRFSSLLRIYTQCTSTVDGQFLTSGPESFILFYFILKSMLMVC